MNGQWLRSRAVKERIFVRGRLTLETPAHFGNGDTDALTDIPLLRDARDSHTPLLTGASIAGALRNYVREYYEGFGQAEQRDGAYLAEKLFGHLHEAEASSVESWLMVDDAPGVFPTKGQPTEIRDGVTIDPKTRTAEIDEYGKGKKYDIELLSAGTTFELSFELWLPANEESDDLREAFAIALKGLADGQIGLGMRKRRGFGQCSVSSWSVWCYDMTEPKQLVHWLKRDNPSQEMPDILTLLKRPLAHSHQGKRFQMNVTFSLPHSLLIRAETGDAAGPDMVHLRSWRKGKERPIVSGTSVAGAIRGRALRIAKTLLSESKAEQLVNGMFGNRIGKGEKVPTGSRISIRETEVKKAIDDRVQNRVKIDRFTGGAYPQALFSQQPLFARAKGQTQLTLDLELRQTAQTDNFPAEVGLLLLVLKDMWTNDLPLGGESSVGRGRLQGQEAILTMGETCWIVSQQADKTLKFEGTGKPEDLENIYLAALLQERDQ